MVLSTNLAAETLALFQNRLHAFENSPKSLGDFLYFHRIIPRENDEKLHQDIPSGTYT